MSTHNRLRYLQIFLVTALLVTSLNSCDAEDAPVITGSSSLLGSSWEGQLTTRAGQNLSSTPIAMLFTADSSFQALNLSVAESKATGTYRDMPIHSSMMLEVTESNFPEFANAGNFLAFDYSAKDHELVIKSDNLELRLIRNSDHDDAEESPLTGSWVCPETRSARWQLDLSHGRFWARRSMSGRRALRIEGNVYYEKTSSDDTPATAILKITSATEAQLIGAMLRFSVTSNERRLLEEIDEQQVKVEDGLSVTCSHE